MRSVRVLGIIVATLVVAFAVDGSNAWATPFTKGDIFASIGNGKIKEFTPGGVLVQTLDSTTGSSEMTGSAFDSSGNFYATGFQTSTLSKFNNSGVLQSANFIATHNPTNNESIVFDASGNFYVGGAGGNIIRKFSSAGTLLDTFTGLVVNRGTDWIDLAKDQKTIFYTSESGFVRRYDTSTHTQLTDFTSTLGGVSYALRLLADGGALVAHTSNVLRLDSTGAVIHTYTIPGGNNLFALNLDPDGESFWTGNIDSIGELFHIRISDGALLGSFNTVQPGGIDLAGLAIFGEITQGCEPNCNVQTPEPATLLLIGSGLIAAMAVRRRARRGASDRRE
jgi:hypothetical protein